MAQAELGNRARKVNEILAGAEPSQPGLEAAIDRISRMKILFVDSGRLEDLANRLRDRVKYGSTSP